MPINDTQDPAANLEFPVQFELRIIYLLEADGAVEADVEKILGESAIRFSSARRLPTDSAKYRRLAVPVTFENRPSMHAVYTALGKLPYIKAVM